MKWPQRWLESPSARAIELQGSSTVYTSVRPPAAAGMPSFAETLQRTGDVVTRALKTSPNFPRPRQVSGVIFVVKCRLGKKFTKEKGEDPPIQIENTNFYWALLGNCWDMSGVFVYFHITCMTPFVCT